MGVARAVVVACWGHDPRPQTSQVGNRGTEARCCYGESTLPRSVMNSIRAIFLLRSPNVFIMGATFIALIAGVIGCRCPGGAGFVVSGASGPVADVGTRQRWSMIMIPIAVTRHSCLAEREIAGSGRVQRSQ